MSFYQQLVDDCQMNFAVYNSVYGDGGSPIPMSTKDQGTREEQIERFAQLVKEADCVVVGGASGLSAAGGGDFYYDATPSYMEHFGKYARKYGFKGAFDGTFYRGWPSREEFWGYLATFLHTTQHAPVREPYVNLDAILKGKDFFVVTTNQDTQFTRLYPEEKLSQLQGDHRFFQCSKGCTDEVWDAIKPVEEMFEALGDGTSVPTELIPRCPHCGAEAFPWVRGYGNFLQGTRYENEYEKISVYLVKNANKKILFIELGVGRMTPMFIQEPFWALTAGLQDARYIGVNLEHAFLPRQIEDKGTAITADIGQVLRDVREKMEKEETPDKKGENHEQIRRSA